MDSNIYLLFGSGWGFFFLLLFLEGAGLPISTIYVLIQSLDNRGSTQSFLVKTTNGKFYYSKC